MTEDAVRRVRAPLVVLAALGAALLAAGAAGALDTAPPYVGGFSPQEGGFVNAGSLDPGGLARVELTAQFFDADSALSPSNTRIAVWSVGAGRYEVPEQTSAQQISSPSSASAFALFLLPDGLYRSEMWARDDAGNEMTRSSTFVVDTTPPDIQVAAPALTNESTVRVRLDATDGLSGVSLPAILSYKGDCSYNWATTVFEVTQLPGRVVGVSSFTLCVGSTNQFTAAVTDRAGNTAQASQTGIIYDRGGPTFSGFEPDSFDRLDGPQVEVSVRISDDASGVNESRVEIRLSEDGGRAWGDWGPARAVRQGGMVWANATFEVADGATAAIEWRAWDNAGNGPSKSRTEFFYVNGPPFVESFEPAEGAVIQQYSEVRLFARFADPDADTVDASFRSDIDGPLGRADGTRAQLSLGVHNLTLTAIDGHGHTVSYTYQVQVVVRPPPDPRPMLFTAVLAGAMLWAVYAAYSKEEEQDAADAAPKA